MTSQSALRIASAAAVAATLGDLLMLYVANAARAELALPPPPAFALGVGAMLGVVAIPLYALGYIAVANAIGAGSRRDARIVRWCGIGAAGLGASIHAGTALAIRGAGTSAPPLEAVAASGRALLIGWALASLLVLVASVVVFRAGAAGRRALPRAVAWLNPAAVTLLLGAAGLPWEIGRSFLVPAAPNLAHVVFFASLLLARRDGSHERH
jgi:hypothetical protein